MIDLDPRLRRELGRLRAREGPPRGAEERVLAALRASVGAGPGGSGGEGAAGHASSLAFGAKVVAATLALAGAGLVAAKLVVLAIAPAPSPSPSIPATAATTPATEGPAAPTGPSVPSPPSPPSPPSARERAGPAPAPHQPPRASIPGGHASGRGRGVAPTTTTVPASEAVGDDPLTAELALMERARASDDPETRLQQLGEHRTRFPRGVFAVERDTLEIVALCESGRTAEARRAADRFFAARPRSPQRARVRSACPELGL